MAPRETENNAYAKFWGDKQRTLWYVMVFLEWSINHFLSKQTDKKNVSRISVLMILYLRNVSKFQY